MIIVNVSDLGYLPFNISTSSSTSKSKSSSILGHSLGSSIVDAVDAIRMPTIDSTDSSLSTAAGKDSKASIEDNKHHFLPKSYHLVNLPCIRVQFMVQFIIQTKNLNDPMEAYKVITRDYSQAVFEVK